MIALFFNVCDPNKKQVIECVIMCLMYHIAYTKRKNRAICSRTTNMKNKIILPLRPLANHPCFHWIGQVKSL